jgi:hypothetical protein
MVDSQALLWKISREIGTMSRLWNSGIKSIAKDSKVTDTNNWNWIEMGSEFNPFL